MSARGTCRNGPLSAASFDGLLRWLDPDHTLAAQAYESLRERLIRYFEWRGCEMADALADEVFDRIARRLAEGVEVRRPDPRQYVYGVARLVCLEALKRQRRQRAALDAGPPLAASSQPDAEVLDRLLARCLEELSGDQRVLIMRYYDGEGPERIRSRQRLADELGLPLNALRIRAHRIRERLAACVSRGPRLPRRMKREGSGGHS